MFLQQREPVEDFGRTVGFADGMELSIPPLALSLKIDMVEQINGCMSNSAEGNKLSGVESS